MVAYNFQARFVPAIQERIKPHTLRDVGRRRHAHPGETVQLYTGQRTRACRLIGRACCDRLQLASLNFQRPTPIILTPAALADSGTYEAVGDPEVVTAAEAFAISDGFDSIEDMARFWHDVHGLLRWDGLLIGWDVTTLVLAEPT